ncbi:AAEL005128-PA [Aedes aegypti]|uniref:AAEL005128-PA n=1 Tax=Aedes aegypti TaxID=7159 RepID=Q17B07_AEDAE|nr:AAEL005128-PA [Aedes aegypti]
MHARGGSQWQSRRKPSLGPLRRAHPASGATWNVQVVRGKMTSRCLWHACRALVLGIVLMLVGGGMATVGYYANNFPSLSDVKSNSTSTIRVKNEHRGLHLNNLSYVGPIVMGVGGFIVVASCVMTFEARDSAAKVVPARFKLSSNNRNASRNTASRRSTSVANGPTQVPSQSARWEQHLGVFRTSPAVEQVPDRKALTAALVHFSRALGTPKASHPSCESRRVSRSGSVPNLSVDKLPVPSVSGSPAGVRSTVKHHRGSRVSSMVHRSTRETNSSLLHPAMQHYHRHALSVDEPEPFPKNLNQTGSHGSMHYGHPTDMPMVHKMRDRNKRSDTARKHVLSRQTKIEKDEPASSPKHNPFVNSRRSSTISNASSKLNKSSSRRASTISKTPSVDSRGAASTVEVNSPERSLLAMTPRKANTMAQMSTPSVEKECRYIYQRKLKEVSR